MQAARPVPAWPVAIAPFAFALLGPFLPLLIVFAGTLPPTAPHPSRTLALFLGYTAAVAMLASLAGLLIRGVRRFPKTLWLPLGAIFVAQAIALVWAIEPKVGIFSLVTTLGGYIVLIAASEVLGDTRTRHAFLACYLISGAIAAIIACALSVMKLPPAMFAYEHGRASGTFLQPNELAGYLLFLIPLGLAQGAAPSWLRAIGFGAAAAGATGLILSVSRAAIISLVLGLVFFVRKLGQRALLAYVAAAVVGLLLLVTVFRDVAHDPSENASRLAVWAGALRIAQRFALTGVGPFGFHLVYPHFRLPEYSVNEVHAHSLPLHIIIEYGVLGLAACTWFAAAAITECAKVKRSIEPHDRERNLLFAALVCGFAASALQNAIDVVTTFLFVVAWPMLGMTLALGTSRERVP